MLGAGRPQHRRTGTIASGSGKSPTPADVRSAILPVRAPARREGQCQTCIRIEHRCTQVTVSRSGSPTPTPRAFCRAETECLGFYASSTAACSMHARHVAPKEQALVAGPCRFVDRIPQDWFREVCKQAHQTSEPMHPWAQARVNALPDRHRRKGSHRFR